MQHQAGFIALCEAARRQIQEIDIKAVKQQMETGDLPLLIDVREEKEWQQGHLQGAMHLGRGVIERDIEACVKDKHTPMILYCGGGYRSALAAESLQKMGYTQVMSLAGGWRIWTEAGYPVEKI